MTHHHFEEMVGAVPQHRVTKFSVDALEDQNAAGDALDLVGWSIACDVCSAHVNITAHSPAGVVMWIGDHVKRCEGR